MIDRTWVRRSLTGPVTSIRTPFLEDGSIDFRGLRRQIDLDIAAGSPALILTAGDSHYFALSDDEIAEVTRATTEHANRRAMVVAADRQYNTQQSIDFARYCREVGADVLMVLPPDWAHSCTPETLVAHYAAVAEHIPVMIVTNVFIPRGEEFGLRALERTLAATGNVVAIKDDMGGSFARRMALMVHDQWAVISGGQKQNHLNMRPYGCDGYFSTFLPFMPEIARRYWSAIEENNLSDAAAVIRDFDLPFFSLLGSLNGGFNAGIHGVFELFGICHRWRRPPYHSLSDGEMAQMRDGLEDMGVKPSSQSVTGTP